MTMWCTIVSDQTMIVIYRWVWTTWQCDLQLYLIKQWLWFTDMRIVICRCVHDLQECAWFAGVCMIYRHEDYDLQVCAWFAGVCMICRWVHDLQVSAWFAGVCVICRCVHDLQVCAWFAGECLAGALHWEDLHKEVQQMGFSQPRLVRAKMVDVSRFTDILGQPDPPSPIPIFYGCGCEWAVGSVGTVLDSLWILL